jgi:hypothetical protein
LCVRARVCVCGGGVAACTAWAAENHTWRYPLPFNLPRLQGAIRQFDIELAQFGPNLTDLIHRQGKALVLSEYGVGGGVSRNGSVPAATAAEAAALPFFGVFGQYSADRGACVRAAARPGWPPAAPAVCMHAQLPASQWHPQ